MTTELALRRSQRPTFRTNRSICPVERLRASSRLKVHPQHKQNRTFLPADFPRKPVTRTCPPPRTSKRYRPCLIRFWATSPNQASQPCTSADGLAMARRTTRKNRRPTYLPRWSHGTGVRSVARRHRTYPTHLCAADNNLPHVRTDAPLRARGLRRGTDPVRTVTTWLDFGLPRFVERCIVFCRGGASAAAPRTTARTNAKMGTTIAQVPIVLTPAGPL